MIPVAINRVSADVLRRLQDAVDPVAHDGPGQFLPDTALVSIRELIGCDAIAFQVMDVQRRDIDLQTISDLDDGDPEDSGLFWAAFWECLACCYPQRTGDYVTVRRLSDFYTPTAFRGIGMSAYWTAAQLRHEVLMPLPPDGARDHRMMLFRCDGRNFTDADVFTLQLLRPHLIALHLRQRRRRAGIPELTARQMQVLTLIAAGCNNVQVARALDISEATVSKHLENAYARLDVNSRTAAVARILKLPDDAYLATRLERPTDNGRGPVPAGRGVAEHRAVNW